MLPFKKPKSRSLTIGEHTYENYYNMWTIIIDNTYTYTYCRINEYTENRKPKKCQNITSFNFSN